MFGKSDEYSDAAIITKANGTESGKPIVMIHFTAKCIPPGETDPVHIPVALIVTGQNFMQAAIAISSNHPTCRQILEDLSNMKLPEPGRLIVSGMLPGGRGWEAAPFNGYFVKVEGQPQVGLATDRGVCEDVAKQLAGMP